MDFSKGNFSSEIITMNDDRMNPEKKKRSVKSYASRVFQESTIGMVASIVSTHSRARRGFKSLLLLLCISGFLYQCSTYLIHVFEYQTVVDVDIQRPKMFNMPAYTFCNNNGMKRSVFCATYPDRCFEPNEKFCSRFSSYCGSNKTTLVPMKKYFNVEDTMSFEEILKYGDDLNDFLVVNKSKFDEDLITGPYLRPKESESGAMICYSLHSVVESRQTPKQKERRTYAFENVPADKLTFYIEESEMFIPGNGPGVMFSIHSPYEAVNPFLKGIFMKPGRTYKIYISMVEEILLKAPFQTKCLDYEELWEANNRTGPRIQQMCEHKCLLEISVKGFNCSAPSILYPNNERKCTSEDLGNGNFDLEVLLDFFACLDSCKDDCRLTKYTSEIMERYEVDYKDEEDHGDFKRFVTVEIYLEDGEIVTLRHSPKYLTVEVFSAIGGFIGVWLGISLMDIIDVVASGITVCRYALRKRNKQHIYVR